MNKTNKSAVRKPLAIVVEIANQREQKVPPGKIRTYHPRKGWIITEAKNK
jgi:hypothetical protein